MQVQLNTLNSHKIQQAKSHKSNNNHSIPVNMVVSDNTNFMPSAYYAPSSISGVSPTFKANVISFCGGKEKSKKVFLGAELPPYNKVGGVATVMKDYAAFNEPMVIPYYNGNVEYDSKTGKPTGKVSILRDFQGNPIYTNKSLDEMSLEDIIAKKQYWELEPIKERTMAWGDRADSPIGLYKVKGTNHYMVYTESSAMMPKPYATETGEYTSGASASAIKRAQAVTETKDFTKSGWKGTYTGEFAKAFVELFPETGYQAETFVCSDVQMAYVPHFMQQKAINNDPFWADTKPTYVAHNLGDGYTDILQAKEMFVNLGAGPDDIKKVQADPEYLKAFTVGGEENYFKKFLQHGLDANGNPCSVMIPCQLRKDGYLTAMTTVAELYGQSVATNPEVSSGLYPILHELFETGRFTGILNPLQDPSLAYDQPIGLKYYGNEVQIKMKDGSIQTLEPFKVFSESMSVDDVKDVKRHNRINLLSRLTGEVAESDVDKIAGLPGRKADLIGNIDKSWIERIKSGEDIKLFVSWGRGDKQKGLDTVLSAFLKHAKTPEGKNSILVLGGELGADKETADSIRGLMQIINSDATMKGRVAFINGFAPGIPMASAADCAILPSRFAPCELCDWEALKKFCCTIVTNTQGLKQKNFDPDIPEEAARATSYRTQSEFYMSLEDLKNKSPEFKETYDKLLSQEISKLRHRGVQEDLIEELAKQNLNDKEVIQTLRKQCTDEIISNELVGCMKRFIERPREIAERMLENMKNMKTDGNSNGGFHPSLKPTWQLYEELHFQPDPQKPKLNLAEFLTTLRNKVVTTVTNNINNATQNATQTATQTTENISNNSTGLSKSKIGMIIAGIVALGGGILAYAHHQKQKALESQENKDPSLVTK